MMKRNSAFLNTAYHNTFLYPASLFYSADSQPGNGTLHTPGVWEKWVFFCRLQGLVFLSIYRRDIESANMAMVPNFLLIGSINLDFGIVDLLMDSPKSQILSFNISKIFQKPPVQHFSKVCKSARYFDRLFEVQRRLTRGSSSGLMECLRDVSHSTERNQIFLVKFGGKRLLFMTWLGMRAFRKTRLSFVLVNLTSWHKSKTRRLKVHNVNGVTNISFIIRLREALEHCVQPTRANFLLKCISTITFSVKLREPSARIPV